MFCGAFLFEPMLTRDFILRQIQQLVAVLARVLHLGKAGQHEEVLDEIAFGFSQDEMASVLRDDITREDLIRLCAGGSGISVEKTLALADLLRQKGTSQKALGIDNARYSLLHALWLYEHLNSLPNATVHWDMMQRIENLRDEIGDL